MTSSAPPDPGTNAERSPSRPPTRPKRTTVTRRKMTRRLITLSSAAILSVYAAGYLRTESAAEQIAAQERPAGNAEPRPTPADVAIATVAPSIAGDPTAPPAPTSTLAPPRSTPAVVVAPSATPTPVPTTAPTTARYRDGRYVGLGRSRHGNIQATVVIQGGKIVSAEITGCMTRYPCSRIASLPEQVVSQQSTDVDVVSGASDSSDAYLEAVSNALAQAG